MSATTGAQRRANRRRDGARRSRLLITVIIGVGLLIGGALWRPVPVTVASSVLVPSVIAPIGAQSAGWYCPGLPTKDSLSVITLTNTAANAVVVHGKVANEHGATAGLVFEIPARGSTNIRPAAHLTGGWLTTTFTVEGGGVAAVEHVSAAQGWTTSPCASTLSSHWYFADATTATNTSTYLTVANPTTATAVIDLVLVNGATIIAPAAYQGLVIVPNSSNTFDLHLAAPHLHHFAIEVLAQGGPSAGRIVAGEVIRSATDVSGISVLLGAPALSNTVVVAGTATSPKKTTVLTMANLSLNPEHVVVQLETAQGNLPVIDGGTVPSMSTWSVSLAGIAGIQRGNAFAAVIRSEGGSGIVASRLTLGATARGGTIGWVAGVGQGPTSATATFVGAPGQSHGGGIENWIGIVNTASTTQTVWLSTVAQPDIPIETFQLAAAPQLGAAPFSSPGAFAFVGPPAGVGGTEPLLVHAPGSVMAMAQFGPAGAAPGAIALPGIPALAGS